MSCVSQTGKIQKGTRLRYRMQTKFLHNSQYGSPVSAVSFCHHTFSCPFPAAKLLHFCSPSAQQRIASAACKTSVKASAQQLIGVIHPQCTGLTWINSPLSFSLWRCPGLPRQEGWGWWSDLLWCLSLPPGLGSPLFYGIRPIDQELEHWEWGFHRPILISLSCCYSGPLEVYSGVLWSRWKRS